MANYYLVSFQYSASVYCSNIAIAECEEDVKAHYSKYAWYSIKEASNHDVEEAQTKGKPFIECPHIEEKKSDADFTILTTDSALNVNTNESAMDALIAEQNEIISNMGIDLYRDGFVVRFDSNDSKIDLLTIDESIQSLAIKDGCDLVKFDNGNIGFVAYYNNCSTKRNRFEIIRKPTSKDIELYEDGEQIAL